MTHRRTILLLLLVTPFVAGAEFPRQGPSRLAAIRKQLSGTVAKFEFTQGYDFRKQPDRLRPFMQAIKASGFDTWDQMSAGGLWEEKDLADLERSLKVAAEVGLKVWATLCPPSESETMARMPVPKLRQYYYTVVEQFARLAAKYPHFVAFTCDDFSDNYRFFTPEVLAEMARRWRAICPRLAFVPLLYYPGVSEQFFKDCGDYVDGIVFHFRAQSYAPAVIPAYDPKSFAMYGDVMRYELKKVRKMAGDHAFICGIYIWYYKNGWGVLTPDGKQPSTEHVVRDAVQKLEVAHDHADGIRVYGLGIDHEAYHAMGELGRRWRSADAAWGTKDGDATAHLERWQKPAQGKDHLGTLLSLDRGLGHDLPAAAPWPRWELLRDLEQGKFEADQAAGRYPLLIASKSPLLPRWADFLDQYVRAGGILVLEFLPGWSLDGRATVPAQQAQRTGDRGVLTLQLASLSGITFRHDPRGFATRWRVVKDHALSRELGKAGDWQMTSPRPGESTYPYLVYPVAEAGAEVILEAEHERCPYDGVSYVRQGKISGTHPLLTVRSVGRGLVIRHYAAVSLQAVLGKSYEKLLANLIRLAEDRRSVR